MEDRPALIRMYNEKNKTKCKSISDIYKLEGSSRKTANAVNAAGGIGISKSGILSWVKREGEKVNPRGGPNRKSDVEKKVRKLGRIRISEMTMLEVSIAIGHHKNWTSYVVRRIYGLRATKRVPMEYRN